MTENNEMPEEMKNNSNPGNFAIKNAKKYESISEKMKKILESSEKLPQIPTKNTPSNLPRKERPVVSPIDTKALKEAMEGLTQFHDIFKEDQDLSDEIAQTNDALMKMNDNFKGMTEIQGLQLKTLQSMLTEYGELRKAGRAHNDENRSTYKKYFILNIMVALISVAGMIIYFESRIDSTDKTILKKIEKISTHSSYSGPNLAEPVAKEKLFSLEK